MLKSILTSGPVLALLAGCALSAIAWLAGKLFAFLASKPKLAPLEPLAEDAENLLNDEVAVLKADLSAGKSSVTVLTDVETKALADAKADLPGAARALATEVEVLVNGVPTTATTTMGAVVNLPKPKGLVTLALVLIIGGVALAGGLIALFATGNTSQAVSCVEQAINGNPVAVGTLVSGLSGASTQAAAVTAAEGAEEAFGPALGKCLVLDLWDDAKALLARNAALKANAALVAPVPAIVNAAQMASVAKGWFPAGVVAGTTGGTTGG